MKGDLGKIKKKYGENMAKFCREIFPTLLEYEGLLPQLFLCYFDANRLLYDDIVEQEQESNFENYIYELASSSLSIEKNITSKTPKELFAEVGYDFYQCHTEEDVQYFKKYYAPSEQLCTFRGDRLEQCYIFFAVAKNVDDIRREDFTTPSREDLYGTSVISLQFRRNTHKLSIKNRYNSTVEKADATFSNNLDNIIPGLTESFERVYGIVQSNIQPKKSKQSICSDNVSIENYENAQRSMKEADFFLSNYVLASDGRYYRYNHQINHVYYCSNNVIVDQQQVIKLDKSRYKLFDYFILDMKKDEKKLMLYDKTILDAFVNSLSDIDRILLENDYHNQKIYITSTAGDTALIILNSSNQIVFVYNDMVSTVGDYFLGQISSVQKVILPNIEKIGKQFLSRNALLNEVKLGNMIWDGNYFFDDVTSLTYLLEQFGQSLSINDPLDSPERKSTTELSYLKKKIL